MALRKINTRNEALELLVELKESEQTLPEFCSKRGIDGRSLHCWRRNLKSKEKVDQDLRLVKLELPHVQPQSRYRILLGDEVSIEIDDSFRSDTLSRLLQVLEGKC